MKKLLSLLALLTLSACTSGDLDFYEKDPNALQEGSIGIECGESKSDCETLNYDIPEGFVRSWSQLFYDGEDLYASLLRVEDVKNLNAGEWCVFKNYEELLCETMNAGADGPIQEMIKTEEGIMMKYLSTDVDGSVQILEHLLEY